MKNPLARIVLSSLAACSLLCVAMVACTDGEPVDSAQSAISAYPCGLWVAQTDVLAEARHAAAPTNPDMVQLWLPDGLSCSALILATPAVILSWHGGDGAAVIHYVHAPGAAAPDESSLQAEFQGMEEDNGIGTSPSDPLPGAPADFKSEDVAPDAGVDSAVETTDDPSLKFVCTRRITVACGYIFGRTLFCHPCVCEQMIPCSGQECYSCADGFKK